MNVREIKESNSVIDIASSYGIKINRKGFAQCPFHSGDNQGSLKIFKNRFYCYGCGKKGDVIDFVANIENIDFKQAFKKLGGEHNHDNDYVSKFKEEKKKEEFFKNLDKNIHLGYADIITLSRKKMSESEVYSDDWCLAYKYMQAAQRAMYDYEKIEFIGGDILNGKTENFLRRIEQEEIERIRFESCEQERFIIERLWQIHS